MISYIKSQNFSLCEPRACLDRRQVAALAVTAICLTILAVSVAAALHPSLLQVGTIPLPASLSISGISGLGALVASLFLCYSNMSAQPLSTHSPITVNPHDKEKVNAKEDLTNLPPPISAVKAKEDPINLPPPSLAMQIPEAQPTKDSRLPEGYQINRPTWLYSFTQSSFHLTCWESMPLQPNGTPQQCTSGESPNLPFNEQMPPIAACIGETALKLINTIQHIVFHGARVTCIDFSHKYYPLIMRPNVDTMLLCAGIDRLLRDNTIPFTHGLDVGAGSGFIAKHLAAYIGPNSRCKVTAIDINLDSATYMRSPDAAMPSTVLPVTGDAIQYLSEHTEHDLIVSNPPYVPTKNETLEESVTPASSSSNASSFWEGTQLISHLLTTTLSRLPPTGHLVLLIPSTALKSRSVATILQGNGSPCPFQARILYQQEVIYKPSFAGQGADRAQHLIASEEERVATTKFEGSNLDLFVGITHPDQPRQHARIQIKLRFFWQMIYIIDFTPKRADS